jgi:hypothetical protein
LQRVRPRRLKIAAAMLVMDRKGLGSLPHHTSRTVRTVDEVLPARCGSVVRARATLRDGEGTKSRDPDRSIRRLATSVRDQFPVDSPGTEHHGAAIRFTRPRVVPAVVVHVSQRQRFASVFGRGGSIVDEP